MDFGNTTKGEEGNKKQNILSEETGDGARCHQEEEDSHNNNNQDQNEDKNEEGGGGGSIEDSS